MIIDSLTHVTPNGRWFESACDASERRLLDEMDRAKVERAVVVALAGYISNSFVLDLCRRHGGRLLPGASFDPSAHATPEEAVQAFRAELSAGPYRVLKLHPRLGRYDLLDPRCLALLEDLATWPRPMRVWIDTLLYFRGAELRRPPVDALHFVVSRFPKLRFVLLHGAGSRILELADAVRDCHNATIDLSHTLCRYGSSSVWSDLRYLVETLDRRLVFGSDFPEYGIGSSVETFHRLTDGLPEPKKDNVLGRNLTTILAEVEG